MSREPHYFTSGEWIDKKEIMLSGWPINKKAKHLGRINAGGTNMAKKMLARMEKAAVLLVIYNTRLKKLEGKK